MLIDKPLNWTSFDAVNKIRYAVKRHLGLKKVKVGHAGTLDPLATGLLIIAIGKATKTIDNYLGQDKEYTGTFTLGATTPSFDLETEIDQTFDLASITEDEIRKTAADMVGEQLQLPPMFSAKKVDGKKAYTHARKGETIELKRNLVNIKAFEITKINLPEVHFRILCSKGTYIRSIANDFGENLNNGAHLSALRRTKIGDFKIEDATTIEEFTSTLSDD